MKRLLIVVAFRDRAAHLRTFVPHLKAYFTRDKIDKNVPYRVLIVEQTSGSPFNKGALCNVGFSIYRDWSDYTCFHDVDYLPIWADYSFADRPTPLVWHGAERRPIATGRSSMAVQHQRDRFWGGAVLVPNGVFTQVDGFSNDYWGWGWEDTDLARRFDAAGIATGRRTGTFSPLDHDNRGFQLDGEPRPIARVNERLFLRRWADTSRREPDGLSTLRFEIKDRRPVRWNDESHRDAPWEVVTVDLKMQPSEAHQEALELDDAEAR